MSPRPILKRFSATDSQTHLNQHHHHHHHINHSHGVHFPPSPSLTRTFSAHSSAAYDRSPIVVSPNTCALPERGCPGRTYLLDEQASPSPSPHRRIAYARDYHPRALAFATTNTYAPGPVPQLVPDLSSESDESDGFYSIPTCSPTSTVSGQPFGIHGLAGPSGNVYGSSPKYTNSGSNNHEHNDTLGFLPYGPSSPPHFINDEGDDNNNTTPTSPTFSVNKQRRRRSSDRRHESCFDPDRIPGGGGSSAVAIDPSSLAFGSLTISTPAMTTTTSTTRKRTTSPHPPRKKGVRRTPPMMLQFQQQASPFGFGQSDDGCLGGF